MDHLETTSSEHEHIRKRKSTSTDTQGPMIRRMSRLEPRPSVQYGGAGGYASRRMSHARSSFSGLSWTGLANMKQAIRVGNTYRLAPRPEEKFNSSAAQRLMSSTLQSYLDGERYDKNLSINLSKTLADVIKERMKDQGFSQRYKYVCVVTMGEKKDQGMAVCSRCVWNTDTDNFASASYTKGNLFAVATLYAMYYE